MLQRHPLQGDFVARGPNLPPPTEDAAVEELRARLTGDEIVEEAQTAAHAVTPFSPSLPTVSARGQRRQEATEAEVDAARAEEMATFCSAMRSPTCCCLLRRDQGAFATVTRDAWAMCVSGVGAFKHFR